MKKILLGLSLLVAVISSRAQEKYAPVIKQGTKLGYSGAVNGQSFALTFSFDSLSADYVNVGWNVDGYGSGNWVMRTKSLESGTRGYWGQPSPGATEDMADDQIVLLFSKAQWQTLQKENQITFDQQTFTIKKPDEQQQLKIDGRLVDAFYLENANGSTRLWILNNAASPVLLKIEGNTQGADIAINSVE